jgi:peptidyl-prolyl cis-trans isomerase B (cyclophilin B)
MKKLILFTAVFLLVQASFAQNKTTTKAATKTIAKKPIPAKGRLVEITTNYGTIVVRLYDSTPLHRDNFIRLVQQGFYDSLLFHRVIQGFMIQGGDPNSKSADSTVMLGAGEAPGDRIPAEFHSNLIHKKGALAAARDDNPEKASSNCQFYIVQGQKYNDTAINMMECNVRQNNPGFTYSAAQRNIYKTIGGTPFLDQNYTVFGEVVKGLDVIDKIAALPCDQNNRPLSDVRMKMKLLN